MIDPPVTSQNFFALFGLPPRDLVDLPPDIRQVSPLVPGSLPLEDAAPASLTGMILIAPAGTLERQYVLALGLKALKPEAPLTVLAPKTKGGNRIAGELESFGCEITVASRRHHRICTTRRSAAFSREAQGRLDAAVAAGAPRLLADIDLWSQPGIFSWDRLDNGTAALLGILPPLAGHGADLGCGTGILARAVLASPQVKRMELVDIDRRAVAAAMRNVTDPRAVFHWADARHDLGFGGLDFVVMNPPFHDGGLEDRALGEAFVRRARACLRSGGTAWLVANRHLPYEPALEALFAQVVPRAEKDGYKVYEAKA